VQFLRSGWSVDVVDLAFPFPEYFLHSGLFFKVIDLLLYLFALFVD